MCRAIKGLAGVLVVSTLAGVEAPAQVPATPVRSALEPATTGGLEVVDRALAKLSTHARLLVIGAHPDDEDTALLTLVSRSLGGEAAYLSLSRGEGGQNLIGAELGEGLGLLRTQELLAARRIDGGHQFFTRAFDFGYTRSLDETLERWPREVLLEDVARVVWRFRPQVMVAMFSPEVGGHGQHLAAGWVAQRLFGVAGTLEAGEAPELPAAVVARLRGEGWLPWRPEVLYRRTFFDPESASFDFAIDAVEAISGRSVDQLAMASRSQHRSQDMGMLQPLGSRRAGLERVAGGSPEVSSLFGDVDTGLAGLAGILPEGSLREEVESGLRAISQTALDTRAALSPVRLADSIGSIAEILDRLRAVRDRLRAAGGTEATIAAELVEEKIEMAETGLAAAASVGLDAVIDHEAVAPGGASRVVASVWDAGAADAEVLAVELETSPSWSAEPGIAADPDEDGVREWSFGVRVHESAEPSLAYFSRAPRDGDLYDWDGVVPALRGLAYQEPELRVRFRLSIAGRTVERLREVVHVTRDQATGEVRRPVRVVPRLEVAVEPRLLLWDERDERPRPVRVTLRSHLDRAIAGRLEADRVDGWSVPSTPFSIPSPAGEVRVELEVHPPRASAGRIDGGRWRLGLRAELEDGAPERLEVPLIEYPHIRPTPMPLAAEIEISAFEIDLPPVGPVGYVRGASDLVPEFLRAIGVEVEMLDAETLLRGDLGRYRVILVGSRAYETDPALAEANGRLLEFVRGGGRLLVQYQQYQYVRGGFAPFGLDIARPHDRITDEAAPVALLVPEHPVFTRPNALTAEDWEGWVQERGLYFAHTWGEELVPLLSMADPGSEEQRGGLLIARLGEGTYVYTGLAFFRQLPAGVAGGYRLLANLLAAE
jgi:LmbE family N-acetylglucosaminyl deacetylase